MKIIFWVSLLAIFYAYFGYPITLVLLGKFRGMPVNKSDRNFMPGISMLIPVHNELDIIKSKLENTRQLDYPPDLLEVVFISDGSTDGTDEVVKEFEDGSIRLLVVNDRKGKGHALNLGLKEAGNDIIIFSDASILLDSNALKEIVIPFQDNKVGCVSGEDHIKEAGGEGAYGRYELWLRNLESQVHSLVGASGSFYAQRKFLCQPFIEGLAPDFLSVLNTVEQEHRAISEPNAFGFMESTKSTSQEFNRKIRTLIRGMSAFFHKKHLLNFAKYGVFSLALFSHKLMRWLVPFFLISLLISNLLLIAVSKFYTLSMLGQVIFYGLAFAAHLNYAALGKTLVGKIALYFTMVNISILIAWKRYLSGVRQEVWDPTKR